MRVWLPAIRAGTGVDVFTVRLATALRARGVDADITWFPAGFEFLPELMRLHGLPPGTDVIHANGWLASSFVGRGVPVVATVHHLVHDPAYAPYRSGSQALYHRWHIRWREQRAVLRAAAVTAVSPYVAETVRTCFGRQDIESIPNWVDTARYRPAPARHPDAAAGLRLLWVGNPSRRKGVDLLPALAMALGPGYQIRCVGGLRGDQVGFSSKDGLTWLGRLSETDLIDEYQRCDVLLSLSRYEGFGYTALEAMACGKPVVAFAAGGLVDVVQHGVTGLLAPIDDVQGFANCLRQLEADPRLRQRMGQAAREYAGRQGGSVDAYLHLYRRLCGFTAAGDAPAG